MQQVLYTFEYDGELFDMEGNTPKDAKIEADNFWIDRHSDLAWDGNTYSDDCYIIGYTDTKEVSREKYRLEHTMPRNWWRN